MEGLPTPVIQLRYRCQMRRKLKESLVRIRRAQTSNRVSVLEEGLRYES
jgi:hypothetical protein